MGSGREVRVVMFTDLVGYSAISQKDDALAVQLLDNHFKLMRPIIKKYKGTIIKTIGDALMVSFKDSMSAVNCAVEMQQKMKDDNKKFKKKIERLKMRIGLHKGEVIIKDNDLFGDDVNIAARIEPQADATGICVSKVVYDEVYRSLNVYAKSIGKKPLKNIKSPPKLYKINPYKNSTFLGRLTFKLSVLVIVLALGVVARVIHTHKTKGEIAIVAKLLGETKRDDFQKKSAEFMNYARIQTKSLKEEGKNVSKLEKFLQQMEILKQNNNFDAFENHKTLYETEYSKLVNQ